MNNLFNFVSEIITNGTFKNIMNGIGIVYLITCLIRLRLSRYRTFQKHSCKIMRVSSKKEIPSQYVFTRGGGFIFLGSCYPLIDDEIEHEYEEYLLIIPNEETQLRDIKIYELNAEKVNKESSNPYDLVKSFDKEHHALCVHGVWTDSYSKYKITWRDEYGKQEYTYSCSMGDIESKNTALSRILYIFGIH